MLCDVPVNRSKFVPCNVSAACFHNFVSCIFYQPAVFLVRYNRFLLIGKPYKGNLDLISLKMTHVIRNKCRSDSQLFLL